MKLFKAFVRLLDGLEHLSRICLFILADLTER